jgi:hypothetical protein
MLDQSPGPPARGGPSMDTLAGALERIGSCEPILRCRSHSVHPRGQAVWQGSVHHRVDRTLTGTGARRDDRLALCPPSSGRGANSDPSDADVESTPKQVDGVCGAGGRGHRRCISP